MFSKLDLIGKEQLQELINSSTSLTNVLEKVGLRAAGGNYMTLKKIIKRDNLQLTFSINSKAKKNSPKNLLLNLLIQNSTRTSLKKRILKEGLLKEECSVCGLGPIWNNEPITLQLDHINGVNNDNRLENLRILCPNCHSQTSTFAGRSAKKVEFICKICIFCQVKIHKNSKTNLCITCAGNIRCKKNRNGIEKPTKEVLEKLIWEKPSEEIALNYNISGSMLTRWCKHYEIKKPTRGYWTKKKKSQNSGSIPGKPVLNYLF